MEIKWLENNKIEIYGKIYSIKDNPDLIFHQILHIFV